MSEHHYEYPHVVAIPSLQELPGPDDFGDFAMDKENLVALPAATIGAVQGFNKYYMGEKLGVLAWGAMAASIVAYDAYAVKNKVPTLTRVAHEAINKHPILTRSIIGAVAVHLALPKIDPISLVYDILK